MGGLVLGKHNDQHCIRMQKQISKQQVIYIFVMRTAKWIVVTSVEPRPYYSYM